MTCKDFAVCEGNCCSSCWEDSDMGYHIYEYESPIGGYWAELCCEHHESVAELWNEIAIGLGLEGYSVYTGPKERGMLG